MAPELFINVNADFGGAAVGTPRQKFLEVQPADDAAVAFRHPDWILIRRMLLEPRQPRFDCGRFKLGRHDAGRESGGVTVDEDREIGVGGVTDNAVCSSRFTGHTTAMPGA